MCADTSMYMCAHRAGLERYVWWSALLPAVLPICISLMASTAWVRAHTFIHTHTHTHTHTRKAVFACGADRVRKEEITQPFSWCYGILYFSALLLCFTSLFQLALYGMLYFSIWHVLLLSSLFLCFSWCYMACFTSLLATSQPVQQLRRACGCRVFLFLLCIQSFIHFLLFCQQEPLQQAECSVYFNFYFNIYVFIYFSLIHAYIHTYIHFIYDGSRSVCVCGK